MSKKTIRKIMLVFCLVAVTGIIFSCNNKNDSTVIIENAEVRNTEAENGTETEETEGSYPFTVTESSYPAEPEESDDSESDQSSESTSVLMSETWQQDDEISGEDLVNINTADLEELKTLPGIGDVKAQKIISYRETVSVFYKIEDIMNVPGIKEGSFNRIKDYIKV